MNVHVICNNDSVEFAVVNDEKRANEKMTELKDAYFERNKWNFRNRDEYEARCHWRVNTVAGE